MSAGFALGYAGLATLIVLFQIALILGAPWGRLTQGGRQHGALDRRGRLLAALSIAVMGVMAAAVLGQGLGVPDWPRWTGWASLGVTTLSLVANLATPSRAERRLWAPFLVLMLAVGLGAMLASSVTY